MATIVLIEHLFQSYLRVPYMAHAVAQRWARRGHRVVVHRGPDGAPPGDIAILHVDCTVVPEAYSALAARYPRVVNGAVRDIGKRRVSTGVLARDSDWPGPVIVKSDANYGGRPEAALAGLARAAGLAADVAAAPVVAEYAIHPTLASVPQDAWEAPWLVVEKFVPERDERGYYLRVWTFFGDRERSSRCLAREPVIKAAGVIEREEAEVPDEMRELRRRLGFDYGKFDFVLHDGRYYLTDANRTPSAPAHLAGIQASLDDLSFGIESLL